MVVICSICNGSLACPPATLAGTVAEIGNGNDRNGMEISPGESKYEPHAIAPMCGHLFHSSCLANWFANNNGERKCPVCSCNIPKDQMTKIYLSTGPGSTGKSESNLTATANSVNSKKNNETIVSTLPLDLEPSNCSGAANLTLQNPSELTAITTNFTIIESDSPVEQAPLQISETTINGVRTVVYKFTLGSSESTNADSDSINSLSQPLNSRRRESRGRSRNRGHHSSRPENPDRSRSPHHRCNNCSTLEKIQTLMMKEMADLKKLVTEQKAKITSLEQALKLSVGESNFLGLPLIDTNSNLM